MFYVKRTNILSMIKTFSDKVTAAVFAGFSAKKLPPEIRKRAREKLDMLHLRVFWTICARRPLTGWKRFRATVKGFGASAKITSGAYVSALKTAMRLMLKSWITIRSLT